jgi:hypothetical protein
MAAREENTKIRSVARGGLSSSESQMSQTEERRDVMCKMKKQVTKGRLTSAKMWKHVK